jgi:hypothetical protein
MIVTMKEFELGLPAQVSNVITTTPARMMQAIADHFKKVSTEFVCLHPDMPGFESP